MEVSRPLFVKITQVWIGILVTGTDATVLPDKFYYLYPKILTPLPRQQGEYLFSAGVFSLLLVGVFSFSISDVFTISFDKIFIISRVKKFSRIAALTRGIWDSNIVN
jgi:hypothetical protein